MQNDNKEEVPALAVLLGSNVKNWPYSEDTLVHALQLRSQQEQTKRQYYKLENVNKTLEMLKTAVSAGIPVNLIPQLFNSDHSGMETDPADLRHMNHSKEQSPLLAVPDKQMKSYKFPPENQSLRPPTTGAELKTHRRTHSPARIGAEAVAALNSSMALKEKELHGNDDERRKTIGSERHIHKRMMSMPIFKNEPTTGVLNFSAWQTYNGQNLSGNHPGSGRKLTTTGPSSFPHAVRKHRRTHSTNSAFAVIDLNSINQVAFKQSNSRGSSAIGNNVNDHGDSPTSGKNNSKVEKESDPSSVGTNDDAFGDDSSNDTTIDDIKKISPSPPRTLLKGPNYVDNLLNT